MKGIGEREDRKGREGGGGVARPAHTMSRTRFALPSTPSLLSVVGSSVPGTSREERVPWRTSAFWNTALCLDKFI